MSSSRAAKPEPPAEISVLAEAGMLIHGERRDDYGSAEESFTKIAELWAPILGLRVSADEVALCLLQLKVARFLYGAQRDSVVDMIGYAALLGVLHGWE